jgi:hypothetical protein
MYRYLCQMWQGLGGVVRKIVNEDLAENIWHSQHMDKIIPSLLYNIQIEDYKVILWIIKWVGHYKLSGDGS